MARKSQTIVEHQGGEPEGLDGRIISAQGAYFTDLDRIQNVQKPEGFKSGDSALLLRIENDIAGFENKRSVIVDERARTALENLRELLDNAKANIERVGITEPAMGEKRKKQTKKEKRAAAREKQQDGQKFDPQPLVRERGDEGTDLLEYAAWQDRIHSADTLLDGIVQASEADDVDAMQAVVRRCDEVIRTLWADMEKAEAQLAMQGIDVDDRGGIAQANQEILDIVDAYGQMLPEIRLWFADHSAEIPEGLLVGETDADQEAERRAELGQHFEEAIAALGARIDAVAGMPLATEADVRAAREAFQQLHTDMNVYVQDWRTQVQPILDTLEKGRWGAWGRVSKAHGALRRRFYGESATSDSSARDGVLQSFGERLKEREREINGTRWNQEFPEFSQSVANIILRVQDARLRSGDARVEAFEAIRDAVQHANAQWQALRVLGPKVSAGERARGEYSPVRDYDGRLYALTEDVNRYRERAQRAPVSYLDDVARQWGNTLARIDALWVPGTEFNDRMNFLRKFAVQPMRESDAEFSAMIAPEKADEFLRFADGEVLRALRARGARTQEEEKRAEQQARARLYHPALEILRVQAKDVYHEALRGAFWKKSTSGVLRSRLLEEGVEIEDVDLHRYVNNIEQYRDAYRAVEEAYARVLDIENPLYTDGRAPEGATSAAALRAVLNTYHQAEEGEVRAWRDAIHAKVWKSAYSARPAKLHGVFREYQRVGSRAFEIVPRNLRGLVATWVIARMRLRATGEYTQWMLDENPNLVSHIQNLPSVFRVARAVSDEPGQVLTTEEKEALTLPVQEVPNEDNQGGGAFENFDGGTTSAGLGRDERRDDLTEVGHRDIDDPAQFTETDVTVDASVAENLPHVESVDLRNKAIAEENKIVRELLADPIFWKADVAKIGRVNQVRGLLKRGVPDARLTNDDALRPDRVEDFYHVAAFTSLDDLRARMEAVRAKYQQQPEPVAAPQPVPEPQTIVTTSSVPSIKTERTDHVPTPIAATVPKQEPMVAPVPGITAADSNPFSRFFGPVVTESRPAAPVVSPERRRTPEPVPAPVSAPVQEKPKSPVARGTAPIRAPSHNVQPRSVREPLARQEIETARAVPMHPEQRVSSWARSIRATVGRWFGADIGDVAASAVTGERMQRERDARPMAGTEAFVRSTAAVLTMLGRKVGFQALVTVPQYFTQSFVSANEKAYLQEEVLAAVEGAQRSGMDNETRSRAHLEALRRVERAIATSAAKMNPELRETMLTRVQELQEKYQERTRATMEAQSKEIATMVEDLVETEVTAWGAAKDTVNSALRVMSLGGAVAFEASRGVAYGVMSFRERFEAVAKRKRSADFVSKVAGVFRGVWEDTWGRLTQQAGSRVERVVNIAEALTVIGTGVGMAGVSLGALEESLPGLRRVAGTRLDGVSQLVVEARASVQEYIDRLLPNLERAAKRVR